MEKKLYIRDAFKFSFSTLMENFSTFFLGILLPSILIFMVMFAAAAGLSYLIAASNATYYGLIKTLIIHGAKALEEAYKQSSMALPVFAAYSAGIYMIFMIFMSIAWWFCIGLVTRFSLDAYEHKGSIKPNFTTNGLFRLIVGNFLYLGLVSLGFLLFIIPGIYFGLRYYFFPFFIIDKNSSILESFKQSALITQGVKVRIFGLWLVMGILMALSSGFAVIILPVLYLALTYIYKKLLEQKTIASV